MSSLTSVIIVDHKFHAITERFDIETSLDDLINDLKEKVKEERPNDLSHFQLDDIFVWKLKGENIIENWNPQNLAQIDVEDEDTVEVIEDDEVVADIGLSTGEALLILQLPDENSPIGNLVGLIAKDLDPNYEQCFLKARWNVLTDSDVESNNIFDTPGNNGPKFVKDFEKLLSQKRMLAPNVYTLGAEALDKTMAKNYFSMARAKPSDLQSCTVNQPEIMHLMHLSSVVNNKWWVINGPKDFNKSDAYWLYFSAIGHHYESFASTMEGEGITVKEDTELWPFELLIKVSGQYHTYQPQNDFLFLRYGLPRLAVQVNSQSQSRPCVDFFCLMLQGASVVQFANMMLAMHKKAKDFIFVAVYIGYNGEVERYLLYQDAKVDPHKVYRVKRSFQLPDQCDCLEFALELYNLSAALPADKEDTEIQVEKHEDVIDKILSKKSLPRFIVKADPPTSSSYGGDQPGNQLERAENGALEDSGYEVVPNVLETDGGTWELVDKLPPHLLTVYRRNDPNKHEFIAKHIHEGSNELAIHEYLRTRRSRSPHIISLIEAIPSTTREWLILPKMFSIRNQWFIGSGGVASRVQLGWGLVKGLAYLHEHKIAHRDIKPDNLLCNHDFVLRIVDFDSAIEVRDENTEIDEYCGTEGWTAPEIGRQDGPTTMYRPIKADRWSCGCVLLRHIMVGKGDVRLSIYANELMAKDPDQRPSLLEWHKSPFSDVASILEYNKSRPRQDMEEVDELPAAKRPRLE